MVLKNLRTSSRIIAWFACVVCAIWLLWITIPWLRTPVWLYFTRPYYTLAAFLMPFWLGGILWFVVRNDLNHPHWKIDRWNLVWVLLVIGPLYLCWHVARDHERERAARAQALEPFLKETVGKLLKG